MGSKNEGTIVRVAVVAELMKCSRSTAIKRLRGLRFCFGVIRIMRRLPGK
jgi:hypothetical protein